MAAKHSRPDCSELCHPEKLVELPQRHQRSIFAGRRMACDLIYRGCELAFGDRAHRPFQAKQ